MKLTVCNVQQVISQQRSQGLSIYTIPYTPEFCRKENVRILLYPAPTAQEKSHFPYLFFTRAFSNCVQDSLTSCSVLQPSNNASNIRHTFLNFQCNIAQVEVKMFLVYMAFTNFGNIFSSFRKNKTKKKETIF